MRRSKMHKIEVGKSKPTENRVSNAAISQQANEWVDKIREAGKVGDGGVRGVITATAYILLDLIREIEQDKLPREVISEVVRRCDVQASLNEAQKLRSNVSGV